MESRRLVARLDTTPEEMRRIANILEQRWTKSTIGQDVPRYIEHTRDGEVHFVIDQDAMHEEERKNRLCRGPVQIKARSR